MSKRRWILAGLGIFLLLPNLVLADCADLGSATNWFREDSHTIIFLRGSRPIARLTIPDCQIEPSSQVRLIKGYVCNNDQIIVDNQECRIMTLDAID